MGDGRRMNGWMISMNGSVHPHRFFRGKQYSQSPVARRAWAPSGSCQEAWPWRGDASFLGKRRAAPGAAEYSLTTTTAASERRRRWQHQGLFLPHPPDCPRMNEQSRTRNLTRARAITHTHACNRPAWRVNSYFSLSDIFTDALRWECLLVTTSDRCLSLELIHKNFHLSSGGKWNKRVVKQLSYIAILCQHYYR